MMIVSEERAQWVPRRSEFSDYHTTLNIDTPTGLGSPFGHLDTEARYYMNYCTQSYPNFWAPTPLVQYATVQSSFPADPIKVETSEEMVAPVGGFHPLEKNSGLYRGR